MRFMIMVRANRETEADVRPDEQLIAEMATYHEELAKAGALVDASGLQPSSKGWRIHYSGKKRTVVDGPYTEAKELIAGYTIIQAKSREEALEWTKRFPNPFPNATECEIEVRPIKGLKELGESEAVQRFHELGVGSEK
ncbi:MAG TPA: YciI family protein [Candidatus Acidoferrum sp.]|nr:YciI family protein [Candidatus Acidoferrum sp.]